MILEWIHFFRGDFALGENYDDDDGDGKNVADRRSW